MVFVIVKFTIVKKKSIDTLFVMVLLAPMQKLLMDIVYFLGDKNKTETLLEKCQHILLSKWSDKLHDRF